MLSSVTSQLETYISSLKPGVKIPYNQFVYVIMGVTGVSTVKKMSIEKDNVVVSTNVTEYDVIIDDTESPRFGEVKVTLGAIR